MTKGHPVFAADADLLGADLLDGLRDVAARLAREGASARAARLGRLVAWIKAHQALLQEALAQDLRRAPMDTTTELLMVKSEAEFVAANLGRWMKPRPVKNGLMSMGTKAWYHYEAKGVVLVVAPWNAPYACSLVPAIGALAAGNAVVIKPSELAPHSADVLATLVEEVFPDGEVRLVQGGPEVAAALVASPFHHIYFTGSPRIGRKVMAAAAAHLTPVTLELGGKSPVVVDASADVADTAAKLAWGKLANAGQACVAPDWVLAHRSVAEPLVEGIISAMGRMYDSAGLGFKADAGLCRMVSAGHTRRIGALIEDARARGATVELGGEVDEAARYVAPTVLTGVTDEMAVLQEEIFGPVLPVVVFDTLDEALIRIRARPKPLAMYIFARDRGTIDACIAGTSAGSTVINHNMIQAGVNPHLSFGGVGESGMGRSVGEAGFLAFSNQRSVVEQPVGFADFSSMSFPPYSALFQRMVAWMMR